MLAPALCDKRPVRPCVGLAVRKTGTADAPLCPESFGADSWVEPKTLNPKPWNAQAGDPKTWRTPKSENYRRMGHWRLLFQFEFAGTSCFDFPI